MLIYYWQSRRVSLRMPYFDFPTQHVCKSKIFYDNSSSVTCYSLLLRFFQFLLLQHQNQHRRICFLLLELAHTMQSPAPIRRRDRRISLAPILHLHCIYLWEKFNLYIYISERWRSLTSYQWSHSAQTVAPCSNQ